MHHSLFCVFIKIYFLPDLICSHLSILTAIFQVDLG